MSSLLQLLIIIVILCIGVVVFMHLSSKSSKTGKGKNKGHHKNRQAVIREAEKELKRDPRNPAGLVPLADLYFQDGAWEKALGFYQKLMEIAPLHPTVNLTNSVLRAGICAFKLENYDVALKNLLLAQKSDPNGFDVNFYLGQIFYQMQQYDKAVAVLKKAWTIKQDDLKVCEMLGLSLHGMKSYLQTLPYLKRVLDVSVENKAVLFAMADSLYNCGKSDKALSVFLHLRADPEYGAESSLLAGMIHMSQNKREKAIKDYEIGLKHIGAKSEILNQIRYNLAQAYIAGNDIAVALMLLREIHAIAPGFKDVASLVQRYQELSQNSNLKIYLMAGNGDFVALCRKIIAGFYKDSSVKFLSVEVRSDVVEIQTEIETPKWEDIVLFWFYRSTGNTGEFPIRDFYGRIKELKAGKGICITAGTYTAEAKKFVDGRSVDLIEKTGLLKVLAKLAHPK